MLSTLARGYGSWTGDLEVTGDKTGGSHHHKPVLITSLSGEDSKFLEKSVNIPLRVKSAVGSVVIKSSSSQSVPSASSLADAIRDKSLNIQHARPKSVQLQRPDASKEKTLRSKYAASIVSKRSKVDLATSLGLPKSTSTAAFAKHGTKFRSVSGQSPKSKEANSKGPVAASSEVKCQRSDGQLELPKTYMTRKGALMLFTAPENLIFSEPDEKCYFKKGNDANDIGKLSLTLGTVNKLTTSVLRYGSQQQSDDDDIVSDDGSYREETHMQFVRDEQGDHETVDYRAQPGADFVFYLRDMQSRAVVRNLVRMPSQQSLVSVDSAEELSAALQSIDLRGNLISPDVGRLANQSQRRNASSTGSTRQQSRNTLSRPSTSASSRSTSLSVDRLAASLKSSPYLGHPVKAPYPPNQMSYPQTQETCPTRHSSVWSRESSATRYGSAPLAQSRSISSAHSVRSQQSQRSNLDVTSQGSIGNVGEHGMEQPACQDVQSAVMSPGESWVIVNDDGSYHGDGIRSNLSSGLHRQEREESLSGADLAVYNDVITNGTSGYDALSLNDDGQEVYNPALDCDSRSSTASHHTYVSGTISLPSTNQDSQVYPGASPLDQQIDQDALLVDHDALLVDQDALLLDNPIDQDDDDDALQESENSGQWQVDSGPERPSPALSARLKSLSLDRPGSHAESLSPHLQARSPTLSENSHTSQGRALTETRVQSTGVLPSSTVDSAETSPVTKGPFPTPSGEPGTSESQPGEMSPLGGIAPDKELNASVTPHAEVPSLVPRLPARKAGMPVVVNRVAEKEMGVPYTTLVPPQLGSSVDATMTDGATARRPLTPEIRTTSDVRKPPAPQKKISKLDLGKLKSMVKPPTAKSQSSRTGGRSKGKSSRPKATGVKYINSLNIDSYQGPSEDEVERMVQEELSKELESSQLHEERDNMLFLVVPEEKADDAVSLATDDEALERELKKRAEPGKKKKSKKSLAKEKAELREARQQEKLRREEELEALAEKKRLREKEKRQREIAEQRRIQMAKEELEDAAQEAERAAQEEEEVRQMLQETRQLQREEREARRKVELERRRLEKEQQRQGRKKMEEAARLREQEMAERLAGAAEKRRLREEAEWERQERERLEQEEREQEEEEEKRRMEEEEERIREIEREAEEEAIDRLVKDREEAERRVRLAREEAERQRQEEVRMGLVAKERKAEEEERRRQQDVEAERKRQEELERIRRIQRLEEEARERVKLELAKRRAWALHRREHNQAQRGHINSMRQTQGMTRPWAFSYYVHWPKENYERRVFVAKKKGFRPRPKPKPKPDVEGKGDL